MGAGGWGIIFGYGFWILLNFYFQQLKQIENIDKCTKCWILAVFKLSLEKISVALLTQKLEKKRFKFLWIN